MRSTPLALALALALVPALASGQQADADGPVFQNVAVDADVRLLPPAPLPVASELGLAGAPEVEAASVRSHDAPAAAQEGGPKSRQWWYLVGAIVAGGIILAILL